MKPLTRPLKAVALCLAAFFTLCNAALLHVAVSGGSRAPVHYTAENDAGCDIDPSRLC